MKIGIIGGGQLARMLTQAALPMGHTVTVLDAVDNCPAAQVGARQIVGDIKDRDTIHRLASQVDVVTVEIEHINVDAYVEIAQQVPVYPRPQVLQTIQNKYLQKSFLAKHDIAHAESADLPDIQSVANVFEQFGGQKMLVKAKYGAFDGRGNYVVESLAQAKDAWREINAANDSDESWAYAEKFVPFVRELAVMVVAGQHDINVYPVTETRHERNICIETYTPARVNNDVAERSVELALRVTDAFDSVGTYGVEMFLTENGELLVNEVAPRVHNSGHWTMDGSNISQFQAHIEAITGQKLTQIEYAAPTVMVNILGTKNSDGLFASTDDSSVAIYNYGKTPGKLDRKLGHINATADTIEIAKSAAKQARERIDV